MIRTPTRTLGETHFTRKTAEGGPGQVRRRAARTRLGAVSVSRIKPAYSDYPARRT